MNVNEQPPPSVIASIIQAACGLHEGAARMRGYMPAGDKTDPCMQYIIDHDLAVESPRHPGKFFATLKGISYAGMPLPSLPDIRGVKCRCGPYTERCPACRAACQECAGAGKAWVNLHISGVMVPTFKTAPCLECDETGWSDDFDEIAKEIDDVRGHRPKMMDHIRSLMSSLF